MDSRIHFHLDRRGRPERELNESQLGLHNVDLDERYAGRFNLPLDDELQIVMADTYKIIRFFQDYPSQVVRTGLTLDEVNAWCNDPETSSRTATSDVALERTRTYGHWFDGRECE